ncbi:hypothetical protein KC356_g8742 [Hortaea werneckii]|nr:hypothetical protein KC356_g8742 [Hortaea werneckii]
MDSNLVSNKNFGAGGQENSQQIGGSHNVQYNADIINYHGGRVQEPMRTSPPPSSTVPFHRDPNFVDRTELETLEEKLSAWNKKVALVGIGGVGKSQLAIEFCYRIRDRSPEIWTFWVHASSAARFDADIRKLACDAGIPGWNDPKSDAFALIYSWLRDERNGKWILVLDNVDDESFLFERPDGNDEGARIRTAYLPPCAHGSTVITSRSCAATARLTDECNTIVVNHMGETAALALLEKKLGQSAAVEDMQKLAEALGYMPLALAQAAAYIKRRGSRYSIGRYLVQLEESEKSQTSLLSSASTELRRDEQAQNSIILTLQISFQHVHNERPSAVDLLSLMSMYNNQGIPEYLLKAGWSGTDTDFDEDIVTLEESLLINITMSSTTYFEMHRLVQVAARAWLRSQGEYQNCAQEALRHLANAHHNAHHKGEDMDWREYLELAPHNTSCLLRLDEISSPPPHFRDKVRSSRALLQYKAAQIAWRQGSLSTAEFLVAESYKTRLALLGEEDKETLLALNFHGVVLAKGGEYEAGEDKIRQALRARERVHGREDAATLTSVSDLAFVLKYQGKYEAAEEASRRVLEGREKMLGKKHPETLLSAECLAAFTELRGLHAEILSLYKRDVARFITSLGLRRPDTVRIQDALQDWRDNYKSKKIVKGSSGSVKRSQQGLG